MTSTQSSPTVLLTGSKIPVPVSANTSSVSRGSFSRSSLRAIAASGNLTYSSGFHSADSSPHHPHYHNHSRLSFRSHGALINANLCNETIGDQNGVESNGFAASLNQSNSNNQTGWFNGASFQKDQIVTPMFLKDDFDKLRSFSLTDHRPSVENRLTFNGFSNGSQLPHSNGLSNVNSISSNATGSSDIGTTVINSAKPPLSSSATATTNSSSSSFVQSAPLNPITRTTMHNKHGDTINTASNNVLANRHHSSLRNSSSLHSCVSTTNRSPIKPNSLSLSGSNLHGHSTNAYSPNSGAKRFEAFIMTGDLILSLATSNSRENQSPFRNFASASPNGRMLRKPAGSELNCSELVKQCLTMDHSSNTSFNNQTHLNRRHQEVVSQSLPTSPATSQPLPCSSMMINNKATVNSTGSSAEHSAASTPDHEETLLLASDFGVQLLTPGQLLNDQTGAEDQSSTILNSLHSRPSSCESESRSYGPGSLQSNGSNASSELSGRNVQALISQQTLPTDSSMSEGYSLFGSIAAQCTGNETQEISNMDGRFALSVVPHSATMSIHSGSECSYGSNRASPVQQIISPGSSFGQLETSDLTEQKKSQLKTNQELDEDTLPNDSFCTVSSVQSIVSSKEEQDTSETSYGQENALLTQPVGKRYPSFIVAPIEPVTNSPTTKAPTPVQSSPTSVVIHEESDSTMLTPHSNAFGEDRLTSPLTSGSSFRSVDSASASRLAKRLYTLDGFKKSDVSRHLCKNNDFAREVAAQYVAHFDFAELSLVDALRLFLSKFCLIGETQERERVLLHFSNRFLQCNPNLFRSADAVHTLTCAIMLLNSDLHGESVCRKMSANEFISNLAGLNDGHDFSKEVLRDLYQAIKTQPLQWSFDDETSTLNDSRNTSPGMMNCKNSFSGGNTTFECDLPNQNGWTEFRKGFLCRKCCVDSGGRRTPIGKRAWKTFYGTLRDLTLYLHKDENGFRKNQVMEALNNSIRVHHCLASVAHDYTKKKYVFRLQCSDLSEYLFQANDEKDMLAWVEAINLAAACLSSPPLPSAIGSDTPKKVVKPILPINPTKLTPAEQLNLFSERYRNLIFELGENCTRKTARGISRKMVKEFVNNEHHLQFEIERHKVYVELLRARLPNNSNSQSEHLNKFMIGHSLMKFKPLTSVAIGEERDDDSEQSSEQPVIKPVKHHERHSRRMKG